MMKCVLTIAGSDPTGGAGLQADISVFSALGLHALAVPSAITVQDTRGVYDILPVDGPFVKKQLDTLLEDIRPAALKTGMLYSVASVDAVATAMERNSLENLVVDPVSVSSSGMRLVEDGVLDRIRERLLPLSRVVTPNIYEASLLSGINVVDVGDMEEAASMIKDLGPDAVIVTGGHLEDIAVDVYYDGGEPLRMERKKAPGEFHGTGCAFSAAITSYLAFGHAPVEAARLAGGFISEAIRKAYHPGRGMGILDLRG